MTEISKNILRDFPIRKSKKQKEAFRGWLCHQLRQAGYEPVVEKKGSSHNVVLGNPETAKVIYTAHYDTCAVMPVPNFITPRNLPIYLGYQILLVLAIFALAIAAEIALLFLWEDCPLWAAMAVVYLVIGFCLWWMMCGKANKSNVNDNTSGVLILVETALALPQELRDEVCIVFFDNEEKGLLGSSAFAKMHKDCVKNSLVINFDCVSDGDSIQFYPSSKLKKKEAAILTLLEESFLPTAEKDVQVVRSFGFYPSDNVAFQRSCGVCALKKKPVIGYYMDRIHTGKDTVLMEENIHLLQRGCVALARKLAAKETA